MSSSLPTLVNALCYGHDAWIVGSAANKDNLNPRDIDVFVPFSEWGPAAFLIPKDAVRNSFGGWKCMSDGYEVDVWPGELSWLLVNNKTKYAWHPRSDTRVIKQ